MSFICASLLPFICSYYLYIFSERKKSRRKEEREGKPHVPFSAHLHLSVGGRGGWSMNGLISTWNSDINSLWLSYRCPHTHRQGLDRYNHKLWSSRRHLPYWLQWLQYGLNNCLMWRIIIFNSFESCIPLLKVKYVYIFFISNLKQESTKSSCIEIQIGIHLACSWKAWISSN